MQARGVCVRVCGVCMCCVYWCVSVVCGLCVYVSMGGCDVYICVVYVCCVRVYICECVLLCMFGTFTWCVSVCVVAGQVQTVRTAG